jgi:hypothetical protein
VAGCAAPDAAGDSLGMRLRRHHIWLIVGLVVTVAAWLAWSALTVQSDLAR